MKNLYKYLIMSVLILIVCLIVLFSIRFLGLVSDILIEDYISERGAFELSGEIRTYDVHQENAIELIPINDENVVIYDDYDPLEQDVEDYLKIAQKINAEIWNDKPDAWKVSTVSVVWECDKVGQGVTGVSIIFTKNERDNFFSLKSTYESQITFSSHTGRINWKKEEYLFVNYLLSYQQHFPTNKARISPESILQIAESKRPEEMPNLPDSQCNIYLASESGDWHIEYVILTENGTRSETIFEMYYDILTEKPKTPTE